jgi:uncharacterized membrane protein
VNLTYSVWLARAARAPEVLPFTLGGIKILDDRIANPAYGLLLVTGLGMVLLGNLSLTTTWILISLILYVIAVIMGLVVFTPLLRRQIELANQGEAQGQEYRSLATRGRVLGILLGVLVIVIVFLMVVKPGS